MAIQRLTGAARWFAETTLAGPTRQTQSTVNVQNSSTQIVNSSPDRVGLAIINNGSFDIFITIVPVGAPNTGIRLGASGGNVTFTVRDDFELIAIQWFGISVGGASSVTAIETIADLVTVAPEQVVTS